MIVVQITQKSINIGHINICLFTNTHNACLHFSFASIYVSSLHRKCLPTDTRSLFKLLL